MKILYLSAMIMETIKSIVNLKCKCPICGGDAIEVSKEYADKRKLHEVCSNEYYTHYQWAGKHYLVKHQSEILETLSLC